MDLVPPDPALPDLGLLRDKGIFDDPKIPGVPPGRIPCGLWGEGFVVWAFEYDPFSRSPRVDIWDASCAYDDVCRISDICLGPIGCEVPRLDDGAVYLSPDFHALEILFSVQGLSFERSTLLVEARSTDGDARFEVTGPGPDDGWVIWDRQGEYQWHVMDWSEVLSPSNAPGLTFVRVAAIDGAIAVRAAALCVR